MTDYRGRNYVQPDGSVPEDGETPFFRGRTRQQQGDNQKPKKKAPVDTVALKKRMTADSARVMNSAKASIEDDAIAFKIRDPKYRKEMQKIADGELRDVVVGASHYSARKDTLEAERAKPFLRGRTRGTKQK